MLHRIGGMHHPQFVMLISWVRYMKRPPPGIVIRKCVTTKSSVRLSRTPGVRSSGTAIEIDVVYSLFRHQSSNSYDSGVTGTRNRSDSHGCIPLRGASKSVNQLTHSLYRFTNEAGDFLNHVEINFNFF